MVLSLEGPIYYNVAKYTLCDIMLHSLSCINTHLSYVIFFYISYCCSVFTMLSPPGHDVLHESLCYIMLLSFNQIICCSLFVYSLIIGNLAVTECLVTIYLSLNN